MHIEFKSKTAFIAGVLILVGSGVLVLTQARTTLPHRFKQEAKMSARATGTFEVKLQPQTKEGDTISRMTIDKKFNGDIQGTSKGEMLAVNTSVNGSAGYVAMEQVIATIKGRKGTFTLQHSATMNRGTPQLSITVVPDSGTEQLQGITGKMMINIDGGKHSYDFEYTLPETP